MLFFEHFPAIYVFLKGEFHDTRTKISAKGYQRTETTNTGMYRD